MYELYERKTETFSKPYDIKCGYAVLSSYGRHIVFPTEEEAWEFIKEREIEREMILT